MAPQDTSLTPVIETARVLDEFSAGLLAYMRTNTCLVGVTDDQAADGVQIYPGDLLADPYGLMPLVLHQSSLRMRRALGSYPLMKYTPMTSPPLGREAPPPCLAVASRSGSTSSPALWLLFAIDALIEATSSQVSPDQDSTGQDSQDQSPRQVTRIDKWEDAWLAAWSNGQLDLENQPAPAPRQPEA